MTFEFNTSFCKFEDQPFVTKLGWELGKLSSGYSSWGISFMFRNNRPALLIEAFSYQLNVGWLYENT